jgi:hypothetical protein
MRGAQYVEYIKGSLANVMNGSRKKAVIVREIGYDQIETATPFVNYIWEKYRFSKSCIWYNLKKLKKAGLLDFSEKGDGGRPLSLTKNGRDALRLIYKREVQSAGIHM